MSALNNLRKKGISLTLGEDEPFTEKVRSYPCFTTNPGKKPRKGWKCHGVIVEMHEVRVTD